MHNKKLILFENKKEIKNSYFERFWIRLVFRINLVLCQLYCAYMFLKVGNRRGFE
jgi:hypothetical protein